MRFAVFGAGGLGAYYGARLAEAGHDVAFIARGAHLEAVRRGGLRVLSPLGDARLERCVATDDPREIGEVDAVLVAVKTWQVPDVARAMGPLLGPASVVVPFLNGVEAPDQLAEVLGAERVLGGLSTIFSMIEAPGVVRHLSDGAYLEIGELSGTISERVERLRAVFEGAGVEAAATADVRSALWRKLLMVSSWSCSSGWCWISPFPEERHRCLPEPYFCSSSGLRLRSRPGRSTRESTTTSWLVRRRRKRGTRSRFSRSLCTAVPIASIWSPRSRSG